MSEPFLRSRPDGGGYDQQGRRPAPAFNRDDPLAELARLVGKDDPFRSSATRAPSSNVASFPQASVQPPHEASPIAAEDDGIGDFHEPGYPDFDAQLRGSLDGRAAGEARPRDALRFPPVDEQEALFEPSIDGEAPSQHARHVPVLNADLWAEGALPQEGEPSAYDAPLAGAGADNRSSRRTAIVLGAVLLLVGGGLGATVLMRGGSAGLGGGAPPTIMASDTPVKVQSPDIASGGTPDGNTALLEKTNSDKVDKAKVVSNNEQPVDLNQLPKAASAQPDAAAPPPSAASPNGFPEPRKVKTVLIRPDGSVVGEAPAQPAPQPPIGMTMPAGADGSPAASAEPPAPAAVASDAPVAKPSTPKSTARISATPKDTAASGGASGAKQAAAPARTPKPKPVAVAEAAPATPAAEETPAAAPGSWSVQLAAPPTEQDARDTAARLQKKFSGELGASKLSIRKADNKSVYRIRVGNLSQDDAKSLCGKLQAGGGSCFIVRN